ncbi:MAG: phage major capsid protein [Actinobacteria bacterium]|nr:phage major capsid protein [Actinomycetota bacterium]
MDTPQTSLEKLRKMRFEGDELSMQASSAWASLCEAREKYGDSPTTAQKRALETLQAEYDRASAVSESHAREYKNALAALDDRTAAPRQVAPELHSYGQGDDLRAGLVPGQGPTIGQVVRAMATGRPLEGYGLLSSGVAGALPDYEVLGIVEAAMQESVVFNAGARVVPMAAPSVKLARVSVVPEVQIKPEAADRNLTDEPLEFVQEAMDAYSAFLYCTASLEALEDVANLEEVLTGTFARQLASAWDKYALAGDGNGQPLGLGMMFAADGVSEVDAGNKEPTYAKFVQAAGRVRAKHHQPSAVVVDVPVWTALASLTDKNDQPLQAPAAYGTLREFVSDHLPQEDYSCAVVGDFTRLIIGVRTNVQIEVDRMGAGFKSGHVAIRGYVRWGSFVDDPGAFAVIRGLKGANWIPAVS